VAIVLLARRASRYPAGYKLERDVGTEAIEHVPHPAHLIARRLGETVGVSAQPVRNCASKNILEGAGGRLDGAVLVKVQPARPLVANFGCEKEMKLRNQTGGLKDLSGSSWSGFARAVALEHLPSDAEVR